MAQHELKNGVFLVAANRLLREALTRVLRSKGGFHIADACGPSQDLPHKVAASRAGVLVLEGELASRPDVPLVRDLLRQMPELRIVLIGMAEQESNFLDCVRAGVYGYVLRDATAMDVVNAVRAVTQGEAICPPQMTLALFRHFARSSPKVSSSRMRLDFGLSRREQQLVPMIAQGLTNKEIANQLNIAEQTVKNHVHRMLRRVGATDRLEALAVFRMQGAHLD